MSFRTDVRAVKMKTDRIVVALETKIFVYNFSDLKLLDHIETSPNPFGLLSISIENNTTILACPDQSVGFVYINNYTLKRDNRIKAHESHLNSLQLNSKGTKLATASQKGTIIRVWNTLTNQLIQEVRRGSQYANIQSINFHPNSQFLVCSSDSGTIHIFGINLTEEEKKENEEKQVMQEVKNPKSQLSFMKSLIPFFNSEWSLAQYRITESQSRVCFGPQYSVIAIAFDGQYYHAGFDPVDGGDCIQLDEKVFNNVQVQ